MIFWILVTISSLVTIFTLIYWWAEEEDLILGLLGGFVSVLISSAVGAAIIGICMAVIPTPGYLTDETFPLRAIGSSSTVQGEFFLGSGVVDGKRTLNYIAQEDGYSRLGQALAAGSRIFEDTDDPTVTEYTQWWSNPWILPWEFKTGHAWDFHVPEGAILENYTIENQ